MAILSALAVAWVGLIALAPFLPTPAAGLLYLFGARICHQLSERSFHLDGAQLPVCARCLGIYIGVAAASVALAFGRSLGVGRAWVVSAAVLNVATVLVEWGGAWHPSNAVRASAGALLGFATAVAVGRVLSSFAQGFGGPPGRSAKADRQPALASRVAERPDLGGGGWTRRARSVK